MLKKQPSIRFQLTCLVLACVIPVWLVAGLLVRNSYRSKLTQINSEMLETSRALTMVVDGELAKVQAALLALATSPSFQKGDFADIHRQTREVLRSHPGADIIVANSAGQQLVNSFRPYGTPLPKRSNPQLVQAIFETGKPVISNLFFGAVTRRPLISVDVPVYINGKVTYDLSMTFPSDRLASILPRKNWPEGWYCTVMDRDFRIVARTRQLDRFVGKQATPAFIKAVANVEEGTASVPSISGIPVLASFSKSAVSGWTMAFGIPESVVMAEIYHSTMLVIGGATAISLFGILMALAIASRIAGDIQSLVGPALALGRGELIAPAGDRALKETAEVSEALVHASELLQLRARERDAAEDERLRAMAELREKDQLLVHQNRHAALGEMIGNIAHQWRQPLNNLGLLVQQPTLLYDMGSVDRDYLDENCRKSMEIILHMSRTIDDFRNFFRPDKEKVVFNLYEEVAKTLSLMEGSLKRQSIAVEIDADGTTETEGYPNEFSQVLLNILINARDAMVEREVAAPRIVIAIGREDGKAVLTVADNGGGIPEEIIDKIFDPYFTTKGPQVGTGVGLFMSKTIIEKNMGGNLTVRNIEGGAEFRITI